MRVLRAITTEEEVIEELTVGEQKGIEDATNALGIMRLGEK